MNTNMKIKSILFWRPATQDTIIYTYNSVLKRWFGQDFAINSGDGISLQLSKNTAEYTMQFPLIINPN